MLWTMYAIGVLLAFGLAILLRKTLFSGEAEPFVMELPPYRMPTLKAIFRHMWDKAWMYLKKAGTIILVISLILWFLCRRNEKQIYYNGSHTIQIRHNDLSYLKRLILLSLRRLPNSARIRQYF